MRESGTSRRTVLGYGVRACALAAGTAGAGIWLSRRSRRPEEETAAVVKRDLSVARDPNRPAVALTEGGEPAELIRAAVDALGGMRRFVAPGDTVLIKPNISWDRAPEQAANTNPEAVAETVRLALACGARKVVVTDVAINEARRSFARSGIADAARGAGASVLMPGESGFRTVDLGGEVLRGWPVLEPFLTADKVINLPVAKHHGMTTVTLGMKNWYGMLGGLRGRLHQRIQESIVDLAASLRPTLTIVDGYRVLVRNGPSGGSTSDVALKKTVIAGTDPVAVDACAAAEFWNLAPEALPYLRMAAARGLGKTEYAGLLMRRRIGG